MRGPGEAMPRRDLFVLRLLVLAGSALVAKVLWQLGQVAVANAAQPLSHLIWPFCALVLVQTLGVWHLYLNFRKSAAPPARPGWSVDVFITAYDEDPALLETTLKAAAAMRYPHRTYLLDDGRRGRLRILAESLGAAYLTREGNKDHKAGNINAALGRTSGELVAVFDADHAPTPDFLDKTLGFFADDGVGFVQAMQTFSNCRENLVTRAAAEATHEYFNIAAVCADSLGAACLHGTNAVIRRSALGSVGGYLPGLAEDLETSIALHEKGWRSRYVCEPLGPGLVPTTLGAFWIQQLKWSRGVVEAALRALRRGAFSRLRWEQTLAYLVRFSYYSLGLTIPLGALTVFHTLLCGPSQEMEELFSGLLMMSAAMVAIRWFMLRSLATDADAKAGIHFRGYSIVYSAWPAYFFSWACLLLRAPIRFMSTPKDSRTRLNALALLPQLAAIAALSWAIAVRAAAWAQGPFTVLFAAIAILGNWVLLAVLARDGAPPPIRSR